MVELFSKKEVDKLMKIKGEVKGSALKAELQYILERKGKDGLERLEETLKDAGHPLTHKEIKALKFYPLGLWTLLLLAIQRVFNLKDEEMEQFGHIDVKLSFIIRLFIQKLIAIDIAIREAPKMWRKYFTVGNLEVIDLNKEKKYIIVRLNDFNAHSIHCRLLKGQFESALQMIFNTRGTCEETKCVYKGDDYHEFLLKW